MNLLDRFTKKKENESLKALVEDQRGFITEADKILRTTNFKIRELESKVEESDKGWASIGAGLDTKRELSLTDLNKLRESCNSLYYKSPEGKAIIRNLVNYIVGTGIDYTCQDENPEVQEWLTETLDSPGIEFAKRQVSIVRRTLREGEVFIHKITGDKGTTKAFRFYHPAEISEVAKDPNDSEVVVKYVRKYRVDGQEKTDEIDADEIHHIRYDVDEDVDRGRPKMENILKRIKSYENWLDDRILLNRSKTNIIGEKIVKGSSSRLSSGALPATSTARYQDDEYAVQAPRPGTIITHTEGIEYKWNVPDIKAADTAEDGRQIRLSIAAGAQMPEYLLTSDASNANYSSTAVAESPFVKSIETERLFFELEFKKLFAWMIKRAIEGGALPATSTETKIKEAARRNLRVLKAKKSLAVNESHLEEIESQMMKTVDDPENYEVTEVPTKTGVDFEWPAIITRNILEETQAIDTWYQNKWISRETAQMRFGLDPAEEKRKIEKEREESGEEDEAMALMKGEIDRLKNKQAGGGRTNA